jgi:hypothetical protein
MYHGSTDYSVVTDQLSTSLIVSAEQFQEAQHSLSRGAWVSRLKPRQVTHEPL